MGKMAKKKPTKAKTHGGKRAGAGRKPHVDGPMTIMAITIPQVVFDRLEAYRKKTGDTRSALAVELIRSALDVRKA